MKNLSLMVLWLVSATAFAELPTAAKCNNIEVKIGYFGSQSREKAIEIGNQLGAGGVQVTDYFDQDLVDVGVGRDVRVRNFPTIVYRNQTAFNSDALYCAIYAATRTAGIPVLNGVQLLAYQSRPTGESSMVVITIPPIK